MKNRNLSEILKKSKLTAEEVGQFILKVNIDKINKHTVDSDNTPILTDDVLKRLFDAVPSSEKSRRIISTYQALSETLTAIYNYSQSIYQQGLFAFYKVLGELRVIIQCSETFDLMASLPLALTKEELEATKKKSLETVSGYRIPLAEAWIGDIRHFFNVYSKGKKQAKIEKALDTVINDSYLCGLRCNQDIVTEGGVHFGLEIEDKNTTRALIDETRKNLFKAHNFKTDRELSEFIYLRAQLLLREIFEDPQAFLSRFSVGALEPSDFQDIIKSLFGALSSAIYNRELSSKKPEVASNELHIVLENYVINVKASARLKNTAPKLVLEQIFGCAPLKYHYAPYENGLSIRSVLERLIEATGNTQEGFNAFLRYIDVLEPLFTGEEGKAIFKTLKDPKATSKAYSTKKTVGELANKGDFYSLLSLEGATSQEAIICQFRKDNPKDPRALYGCSTYQVWDTPIKGAINACERANRNELDNLWMFPQTGQSLKKSTVDLLSYACRVLILCKRFLREFGDIYKAPELASANIIYWHDMKVNLDGLSLNILTALLHVRGDAEIARNRINAILRSFLPLCSDFLHPDEKDFKESLATVRKDPYSDEARKVLTTITDVIQSRALSDNRRKWNSKNQEGQS